MLDGTPAVPPARGGTPATAPDSDARRRRVRRAWLLSLAGFFALGAAWALALPFNGTYDEKQHVVRAWAVATGQLRPAGHAVDPQNQRAEAFRAPASLSPVDRTADCTWWPVRRPASCQRWTADRRTVLLPSAAARYSPVYYLPVGLPLRLSPDMTGLIWARLVSALLCALVLATSVAAAIRMGSRLLVAAIVLVATPLVMNLAGSVNPNGLEIAAGVLVFAAGLALVRATPDHLSGRDVRRLVLAALAGAVLLATVRHLGPVLLGFDLVTCALLARRGRLRQLSRRIDARWAAGVTVAAVAAALGWAAWSGVTSVPPFPGRAVQAGLRAELGMIWHTRTVFYLRQAVGQFGYGETLVSRYMIIMWYLMIAALVGAALARARWRAAAVLAGLAVACAGILVALELRFLPVVGWYAQSRYVLPSAVGVVLGAATVGRLEPWLTARGRVTAFIVTVTLPTIAAHAYALANVITRYRLGPGHGVNPLRGGWSPYVTPVLPMLLIVIGSTLLVLLSAGFGHRSVPIYRTSRQSVDEASTEASGTH